MSKVKVIILLYCIFLLVIQLNAQSVDKATSVIFGVNIDFPEDLVITNDTLKTHYQIAYYFFKYTNVFDGKLVFKPDNSDKNYKKLSIQNKNKIIRNINDINNCNDTSVRILLIDSFPDIKSRTLLRLSKILK